MNPATVPPCSLENSWRKLKAKRSRTPAEEEHFAALDYQRNVLAALHEEERTEGRALLHRRPNIHE